MDNVSERAVELLNLRIKNEEMSSRLYLQMSNELGFYGYNGAASLWKDYSDEELAHANLTYKLLLDLDVLPAVPTLETPQTYGGNFVDIIKASYEHEQLITKECKELYIETLKSGDILVMQFAQWLITEQVEELAKTKFWLDQIDAFGETKDILMMIDSQMSKKA